MVEEAALEWFGDLDYLPDPARCHAWRGRVIEYQYYEFQAIDRPLTAKELSAVRAVSSRARINSTSFTNEYSWGDFKGDPDNWVERYYDAFVYLANWGTHPGDAQRLSEIIKQLALQLLKNPAADPSERAAVTTLMLATAAWNSAMGDNEMRDRHRQMIALIEAEGPIPWAELRSDDTDRLFADLVEYKLEHFPADLRRIVATELSSDGRVQVRWTEPEKVVTGAFAVAGERPANGRAQRGEPMADKLLVDHRKMNRYVRAKVVDFGAISAGKKNAAELQRSVASRENLAGLHPAHAIYVFAQNQVSVMSEQLTALEEMAPFAKPIARAEDEYMPGGPPMSPLTTSFFTCWAFFDCCAGPAQETIGTVTMAVGAAFGMHADLVRVIGLMQESRMGVYVHEGSEAGLVVLRELVTDRVCRAVSPSGYQGRKGELWYVRVLPPPFAGMPEHVVFTTPYLLLQPGSRDWLAYFRRWLPDAPQKARVEAYERHMKFGSSPKYWNEFVLEAYVNHRSDVIFLTGLPDVPESRPHSRLNR